VTPPSNATPPKPPAGNVTPPGRNGTEAPVAPPIQSPCPVTGLILISLVFLRARA
jgi:hypothetical protein